jgi:protein-glutamine gamma-glutamyltransferase
LMPFGPINRCSNNYSPESFGRSISRSQPAKTGIDSEFYFIEQTLSKMGLHHHVSQSLTVWMHRLQAELPATQLDYLRSILELHYRYRFDPNGMEVSDRARLTALSHQWLEEYYNR